MTLVPKTTTTHTCDICGLEVERPGALFFIAGHESHMGIIGGWSRLLFLSAGDGPASWDMCGACTDTAKRALRKATARKR